jgi:hypothetical protein
MNTGSLYLALNPSQILVITPKGKIHKVKCPFRVLCIDMLDDLKPNKFYYVDKVSHEKKDNKICYQINGTLYPHCHFRIFISF